MQPRFPTINYSCCTLRVCTAIGLWKYDTDDLNIINGLLVGLDTASAGNGRDAVWGGMTASLKLICRLNVGAVVSLSGSCGVK